MNLLKKTIAILTFLSVVAIAGRPMDTPSEAAMNSLEVQQYLRAGFQLDAVRPSPNFYIVEPTGDYAWGTVLVQLHGQTGTYETTYANVTVYVDSKLRGGAQKFDANHADVSEVLVGGPFPSN